MRVRFGLAIFVTLVWASAVHADISYDQHISVEASGFMSMLNSEGDVLTQLSGDKSRTDSTITMKSKLASMFAGSGKIGSIVRLDKSLMWNLSPDQQAYSELTFAQLREQMDQARQSMQQAQASGGPGGALPVSAEGCQWTEGEVQVEHPVGTEDIAGFQAEKHIIRMQQSCTDPTTKKTCDVTWRMETSLAKDVPAQQEARKFQQAYAEAMGLGDAMQQVQGPAQSLLGMFAGNWKDVMTEFEKLQGYPLRTVMQMDIGGDQCTTDSGQPIAQDAGWSGGETLGGGMAGALGSAVGGELVSGLAGMFGKKEPEKQKPAAAAQPQANTASGQVMVFRISTETTRLSDVAIPPERFEIPAGWKKT